MNGNDEVACTWSPLEVVYDLCECIGVEICCGAWTCIILILTIILLAGSLSTIESTEQAIAYNNPQAILGESVVQEGLHAKPPFSTFIIWPRTTITASEKFPCLSKDGVVITVSVAYQYTVDSTYLRELTLNYKTYNNWKYFLTLKSTTGMRNACMMHTALEYQTQRSLVQQDMLTKVKDRLIAGNMRATVMDLQLTQVDRPATYEAAVDAKENARNNIEKVKNDRAQLMTQANTNLLKVQVAANKTIATANTAAAMTAATATAEAAVVTGRYNSQAATYKKVKEDLGLSNDALLAYMSVRVVDELSAMTVGMGNPATTQYGPALAN